MCSDICLTLFIGIYAVFCAPNPIEQTVHTILTECYLGYLIIKFIFYFYNNAMLFFITKLVAPPRMGRGEERKIS